MSDAVTEVRVIHEPDARRFRVDADPDAAVLEYGLQRGGIVFFHIYVPEALRGRGLAQQLAHAGFEHAKTEGLRVVPVCPFVQAYLAKPPEYRALVEE